MGEAKSDGEKSSKDLLPLEPKSNSQSFDKLFHQHFDEAWNVAKSITRQDKTASKATSRAFLATAQGFESRGDSGSFRPNILRATRNEALKLSDQDFLPVPLPEKIVGTWQPANDVGVTPSSTELPLESLANPQTGQALIWAIFLVLGNGQASIADLNIRYGLTPDQLADELGAELDEVDKKMSDLKKKVDDIVVSFLLWQTGKPSCGTLSDKLVKQSNFDGDSATLIEKHLKTCDVCLKFSKESGTKKSSYPSVPFFIVPLTEKAKVLSNLAAEGTLVAIEKIQPNNESLSTSTELAAKNDSKRPDKTGKYVKPDNPKKTDSFVDQVARTTALDPTSVEQAKEVVITTNPKSPNVPSIKLSTSHNETLSDALASRFPASSDQPQITQRFEAIQPNKSPFAQDSPVRYSRRPPRALSPEPPNSFLVGRTNAIAAASGVLLFLLVLIFLRTDDTSNISTDGDTAISIPTTTVVSTAFSDKAGVANTADVNPNDLGYLNNSDSADDPKNQSAAPQKPKATLAQTTNLAPTTTAASTTQTTATEILVAVPNVVDKNSDAASKTLTGVGLRVRVRTVDTTDPTEGGLVVATDPVAGTSVPPNSIVTIQVYDLR